MCNSLIVHAIMILIKLGIDLIISTFPPRRTTYISSDDCKLTADHFWSKDLMILHSPVQLIASSLARRSIKAVGALTTRIFPPYAPCLTRRNSKGLGTLQEDN